MPPAFHAKLASVPPTVLVVEDEVVVRALVAEEMRAAGLQVVEAGTADEAWAYLQAGGYADLLFSDVRMPGSMDGVELTRLVRLAYPCMKIVMTSGNMGPRNMGAFDGFMQKPYSFEQAVSVAGSLLGLAPAEEP